MAEQGLHTPKAAGSSPAPATTPKPAGHDWERIEVEYRAGAKSVRELAAEHGISHVSILKRAKAQGWTRDLSVKIKAKADALVTRAVVTAQGTAETKITEAVTVEVVAQVETRIRIAHRTDIGRSRSLAMKLLDELQQQTDNPATFEALLEALAEQDGGDPEKAKERGKRLWEQWAKAMSLGARVDAAKKLAETLRILIDKEREAFGIGNAAPEPDDLTKALGDFIGALHSGAGKLPIAR